MSGVSPAEEAASGAAAQKSKRRQILQNRMEKSHKDL